MCPSVSADIGTDGAKAVVVQVNSHWWLNCCSLGLNQGNSSTVLCFTATYLQFKKKKKKKPVSFKSSLEEAIQIISLLKSQPLSARSLNFLYDEMGSIHKALKLNTDILSL